MPVYKQCFLCRKKAPCLHNFSDKRATSDYEWVLFTTFCCRNTFSMLSPLTTHLKLNVNKKTKNDSVNWEKRTQQQKQALFFKQMCKIRTLVSDSSFNCVLFCFAILHAWACRMASHLPLQTKNNTQLFADLVTEMLLYYIMCIITGLKARAYTFQF